MKIKKIIGIVLIAGILGSYAFFALSQSISNDDRNLTLKDSLSSEVGPTYTDYGILNAQDIQKAYSQLQENIKRGNPNYTPELNYKYTTSFYLFEHLEESAFKKLSGNPVDGLQSDPSGLALKTIQEKIKKEMLDQDIKSIPSSLKAEFDKLRDATGSASILDGGYYTGSTGLYQKYFLLCDHIKGLYNNTENIVDIKAGQTTTNVDQLYKDCKKKTLKEIQIIINNQKSLEITNANNIQKKINEAVNTYNNSELKTMTETTQQFANQIGDVTKKIDKKMENCNPTDS